MFNDTHLIAGVYIQKNLKLALVKNRKTHLSQHTNYSNYITLLCIFGISGGGFA
jgi:hypothetical protein